MTALDLPSGAVHGTVQEPRAVDRGLARADRVFHGTARGIGAFVLVVTGAIGVFLLVQGVETFRRYGTSFFTQADWSPEVNRIGIASTVLGTVTVAGVALAAAFPLALATALYISEYAPRRLKGPLVAMVDLMAAVPSIVYGVWGVLLLQPYAKYVARWLHQYLGWFPLFHVSGADANAASWPQYRYVASAFVAGLVVAMMVVPIACSVMQGVFSQAPAGEREAALALGSTDWGVIRAVVLPFGRGGIVGGTMLGLGRALGETVAVLLIISPAFDVKLRPLEQGTSTISALIAGRFGESSASQLSALMAAGFVLFVMTLVVNTAAAVIVSRSRSGAATEI